MIKNIVYFGIDLAKNVFALHGVDEGGCAALVRPAVGRVPLIEAVGMLSSRTIGMEAYSGANLSHAITFLASKSSCAYINKCSPALSPPKIT